MSNLTRNLLLLLTCCLLTQGVFAQGGQIKKSTTYDSRKLNNGNNKSAVKNTTPVKAEKATEEDAKRNVPVKPGTTTTTGKELPADFPKFTDTGNPESDLIKYQQAKEKWYAAHPKEAAELTGKDKKEVQEVTRARFNACTEEQKQQILNNPDRYKIID